jgi:peptidoglycan/xylan/chitin deacetylase (PgdA/CDA1 family)
MCQPWSVSQKKVIILKADDLRGTITPQFSRYIDFVQSQGIASGLGLIVSSLLDASEDDVARLKTLAAQPESFEIWLHGWGHLLKKYSPSLPFEAEFKGSGIELQTLFLKWSLEAAKLVLGIELHTFGAPGGKYDEDTPKALERFPSLRVWLYGPANAKTRLLVLLQPPDIFIEPSVGNVIDPEEFKKRWESSASKYDVITLQLHPNGWDDEDWARFEEIIRFLKSQHNVQFMTPYNYFLSKQAE